MATFGETNIGTALGEQDGGNVIRGSKGTLTEQGNVSSMSLYVGAVGAGTTVSVTCAIYADSSGTPGNKALTTSEGTFAGTAYDWRTFSVNPVVNLVAGDYWLIWSSNGSAGGVAYANGSLTNGHAYNSEVYPSIPDAFGAPLYLNFKSSIYATYTAGPPLGQYMDLTSKFW